MGFLTDELMAKGRPGVFVAGEMLDWEAPTGGYLLQATFATAAEAANGLLGWLVQSANGGSCRQLSRRPLKHRERVCSTGSRLAEKQTDVECAATGMPFFRRRIGKIAILAPVREIISYSYL